MARYSLRITRFDDQKSFQRVSEFLIALYPDRDPKEIGAALARLPCTLTHDGDPEATRALERALIVRGARTLMTPVGQLDVTLVEDEEGTSQEVDVEFLSRGPRGPAPQRAGAGPKRSWFGSTGKDLAPWEEG